MQISLEEIFLIQTNKSDFYQVQLWFLIGIAPTSMYLCMMKI